ncbi:MAG: hypothetical protein ACMUEM_02415 [Flavobacteriales bacterium AspAUS03]
MAGLFSLLYIYCSNAIHIPSLIRGVHHHKDIGRIDLVEETRSSIFKHLLWHAFHLLLLLPYQPSTLAAISRIILLPSNFLPVERSRAQTLEL